jgi:hypothetical protein
MPTTKFTEIAGSIEAIWGLPLQSAGCSRCLHTFVISRDHFEKLCPLCRMGKLTSQSAMVRSEPPELFIPVRVDQQELRVIFSNDIKGIWLRPESLNIESLVQNSSLIYWPMWLVDSNMTGNWQAEVGFDYQVRSSQETYKDSHWRTEENIETRIRWEPRLGQINRSYENITVPAVDMHDTIEKMVGSYPTENNLRYQPDNFNGSVILVPDINDEQAWPIVKSILTRSAGEDCRKASSGQHIRNFTVQADFTAQNWTQLLLPLIITSYIGDNGEPNPIFINGQTGKIGGVRLASQRKGWQIAGISTAAAIILFAISVLLITMGVTLPFMTIIGLFILLLSIGGVVFAIIAVVWPWQWNRRQNPPKIVRKSNLG